VLPFDNEMTISIAWWRKSSLTVTYCNDIATEGANLAGSAHGCEEGCVNVAERGLINAQEAETCGQETADHFLIATHERL